MRAAVSGKPNPTGLRILVDAAAAVKLNVFIMLINNFNQPWVCPRYRGTAYLEAGDRRVVVSGWAQIWGGCTQGRKSLLTGNLRGR